VADDLDLAAAGLRADDADVPALVEILAVKLAAALPTRCTVERRRHGLLSRTTGVHRVTVDLGGRRFVLRREHRHFVGEVETTVHDMRRRTERIGLDGWLAALRADLERHADESAEVRAALEQLLR
jgi:hypothetical protein